MKKVEYTLMIKFLVDEDKCDEDEKGEAMVEKMKAGFTDDFGPNPEDPTDPVIASSIDVQRVEVES